MIFQKLIGFETEPSTIYTVINREMSIMNPDPLRGRLFEMRLIDIYNKHSWLAEELSEKDFIKLFPIHFKLNKPVLPDKPSSFDLDKQIFLEVLVAFRQSFI